MTRRTMLELLASSAAGLAVAPSLGRAATLPHRKRLGIGMHSYGFHWQAARERNGNAKFSDALGFLGYCHQLGAGGIQVAIASKEQSEARRIRAKAESYGMYFEGQLGLAKSDSDIARFETELRMAKEAGASIVRTVLLGGRRYETFRSVQAFNEFRENSWKSLVLAEPVLKRHGLRLAIENHKDLLVPELLELLRRLSSEFVGVCLDIGNSIALLEEPMEVVQALAPFAFSTHIKDMDVREYEDGFLLS